MTRVEIIRVPLPVNQGVTGELILMRCPTVIPNPKAVLDDAVSSLVRGRLYNEFINKNLESHRKRVLVFGINEFNYIPFEEYDPRDVEIFEHTLNLLGRDIGTLTILRGGLRSEEPIAFMDGVVTQYTSGLEYDEYVEIFLDNPWVRVILQETDAMQYQRYM